MKLFCKLAASLATVFLASNLHGQSSDWPQWRGPNRDGHAAQQDLMQEWPADGPKQIWSYTDAGRGFSSVSVAQGKLFTLGTREDGCYAICLDASTGKPVWQTKLAEPDGEKSYNHGWGGGPRSTPTVDGDQVFVLTDLGILAALSIGDGQIQWQTSFVDDYQGKVPVWGYSESVLIDGDRVVVTPGESNFMIALDRKTGNKVWSSQDYSKGAQYVSIMRGEAAGTSYYVTASKAGLVAFDTATGKKLFEDSATANKVAVIPTPILSGNQIYHTSAYGAGNTLLTLAANAGGLSAKSDYALQGKTMENHHGGTVLVDGVIYGFTKANGGNWTAQEWATGKTLWEEKIRPNRSGSICYADGRLYCYNDKDGTVILIEPSRGEFSEKGKLTLPKQTEIPRQKGAIWAHPVVANQKLFIRDQDLIYAFDIAR